MTPLGTFDAPDLCTLHLVTAGNRFPSKRLNFKPLHSEQSNTFVEKNLRRETPSTSKATNFSVGRNPLSTLPSFDGISTDPAGRKHPSTLMADINKNKGVEFRSQQSDNRILERVIKPSRVLAPKFDTLVFIDISH